MKALIIFLGFIATISIVSRTPPDVNRAIDPTPVPKAAPAPHPWSTPSRLEISGPLGDKKLGPKGAVK